ncbi:programmed cell death protein 2-like [Limanda limanda]|uniref:programmed cell death protein 2-like n=1 Tax=Limanda limanda TaxID=27771 RepID=UPI0029C7B28D|nr:programmed cell death protein 2-like [Limanda limanda]
MAAPDGTLVGVCDSELDPDRHRSSYLTNKVGGQPDWFPGVCPPCPRCSRCGAPLSHVVQVYCPLAASPYHRSLHLFACPGPGCSRGSQGWRVLRSQGLEDQGPQGGTSRPDPAKEAPRPATDWCDTADDWGLEEEEGWGGGVKKEQEEEEAAAPEAGSPSLSSRLQELRLAESHGDLLVFRSFFISVVQESDLWGEEDELEHAQELLREYEGREGVAVRTLEEGGGGGEEKYEKSRARHGDAFFSRFMKRISLCPQQILRYCRGGRTLFISEPPPHVARLVSACGSCGGPRAFELQLMPALVSLLQRTQGGVELEFGTVLVFTCVSSCWTPGSGSAVEEFCFVQTDPDQQLFN